MIKISANVSKKLPVPGVEFSSQSFMAGIEVEVSDGASAQQIQDRIREVYGLLEVAVDRELATSHQPQTSDIATKPVNRLNGSGGNGRSRGNGHNGKSRLATQAQIKAIWAIGRGLGLSRGQLLAMAASEFSANDLDSLSIKDASNMIELLKEEQACRQ